MRHLLALLCLLLSVTVSAAPDVRVRSSLVGEDAAVVGGTLQLQVDVLVDTWFTAAPVLPKLELDGALVSDPSSEATHLNEQIDGKAFFGLRFIYQITPQRAQRFDIPSLAIQVQPGQGTGPVTVNSPPQSFSARELQGEASEHGLVARKLAFTQEVVRSHEPLRVGDSVTRRLHVRAEGAQAMLIPPPVFVDIDGLKRYVQTPVVQPMSDGRGGIVGGSRDDTVTYVIGESGDFRLPEIELPWWDIAAGQARSVKVPSVEFQAKAGAGYQAPFSITDDLRALGQQAQVRIAGHWLALAAVLLVGIPLLYFGRSWAKEALGFWRQWRARRHQQWLDSPEYAWRLAQRQLSARPAQLGGLYLWLRRRTGSREIVGFFRNQSVEQANRLLALFRIRYGARQPDKEEGASAALPQALAEMRQALRERPENRRSRQSLRSLNPGGRR